MAFVAWIAENPRVGDVISGSGGTVDALRLSALLWEHFCVSPHRAGSITQATANKTKHPRLPASLALRRTAPG